MGKQDILKGLQGSEEKLLFSKAFEQALLSEKRHCKTFTKFMDPVKAAKFKELIEKEAGVQAMAYGGAEGCERVILGFCPYGDTLLYEDYPIQALEALTGNPRLTHRDYLGSVLGLGFDRSRVGDIFVFENRAVYFLHEEIGNLVCGLLEKVANTKASTSMVQDDFLIAPFGDNPLKEITVASLRLDAVISGAFQLSRGKAAKLIEAEKALINWQVVKNTAKAVAEGDMITLRGFGRVQIKEIIGTTKKQNIVVGILVYGG